MIPLIAERLTYQTYIEAIVFTNHYSYFTYIHIINGTSTDETMLVKKAYQRVTKVHGVSKINYYRVDYLGFNDKEFIDQCDNNGHTFSYFGVGYHYSNDVAESKNKIGSKKHLITRKKLLPLCHKSVIMVIFPINRYKEL